MLTFRSVPPGAAKKYVSMDERCAACVMTGGTDEGPCISPIEVELYKNPPRDMEPHLRPLPGQLCPRVDLEPGNAEAAQLVAFPIHEMKRGWQGQMFEALTEGQSRDAKAALLLRLSAALSDPVVHEVLYPKPKSTED